MTMQTQSKHGTNATPRRGLPSSAQVAREGVTSGRKSNLLLACVIKDMHSDAVTERRANATANVIGKMLRTTLAILTHGENGDLSFVDENDLVERGSTLTCTPEDGRQALTELITDPSATLAQRRRALDMLAELESKLAAQPVSA